MKMLAASILICLSLTCLSLMSTNAFTASPSESCSCTADDSSCSASVTCNMGGCIAFCPSNGCRAMCTTEDGDPIMSPTSRNVSLRFQGSNSRAVSAELTRIWGQDILFTPTVAGATITLEVDNAPFWDVLEILSKSGRIQIGQDDFSNLRTVHRALLYGERISVCVHGVTVKRLVKELRYLTGLDIRVLSGNEKTVVNFTAKEVVFNDILTQVSEQTGVQIVVK